MKSASAFAVLLFSLFTVQSASAAIIGVRGVDAGSEPATDPAWRDMQLCTTADGSPEDPDDLEDLGFYCFTYDNPFWDSEAEESTEPIFSLDFRLRDEDGQLILADLFNVSGLSEFTGFLPLGEFTFRLFCDFIENDCSVITAEKFTVFSDVGRSVQILAVNGVPNVPEPATLLLVGLGLATAAGRRLGHRHRRG